MCLITDIKEKFIAQEDMIVYKWLSITLESPVQGFEYKKGVLYTTKIVSQTLEESQCADTMVYDDLCSRFGDYRDKGDDLICFGEGFHTMDTEDRASKGRHLDTVLFKCTLPKGTEYYKDATGCIVSNQIIINHEVSNPT